MKNTLSILLGSCLAIGGLMLGNWSSSASAVEMFTNFNNGMELGFRPVRYHSWQPHGWYIRHGVSQPCGNGQIEDYEGGPFGRPRTAVPPPNVPGNQSQDDPIQLRGTPMAGVPTVPTDRDDADWVRRESFMPRSASN
jgi:hypothetical protein